MEEDRLIVLNISVDEAVNVLKNANMGQSFEIENERIIEVEGKKIDILVASQYMARAKNYAAATVIFDNTAGYTKMQIIISGTGYGIFGIDHGAEEAFYNMVLSLYYKYMNE